MYGTESRDRELEPEPEAIRTSWVLIVGNARVEVCIAFLVQTEVGASVRFVGACDKCAYSEGSMRSSQLLLQ